METDLQRAERHFGYVLRVWMVVCALWVAAVAFWILCLVMGW